MPNPMTPERVGELRKKIKQGGWTFSPICVTELLDEVQGLHKVFVHKDRVIADGEVFRVKATKEIDRLQGLIDTLLPSSTPN